MSADERKHTARDMALRARDVFVSGRLSCAGVMSNLADITKEAARRYPLPPVIMPRVATLKRSPGARAMDYRFCGGLLEWSEVGCGRWCGCSAIIAHCSIKFLILIGQLGANPTEQVSE